MLEEKKINKINMHIYFFAYTLILMNTMLGQIELISGLLNSLSNLAIILLVLKCIFQSNKYNKNTFIIIVVTLCIVILSYIQSKEIALVKLALLIISSYGIDFGKLVRYDIKIKTIFILIVIIAYNLGLTTVFIKYRENRSS